MQALNVLYDAVHLIGKCENTLSITKYGLTRFCQPQFPTHSVQERSPKRILEFAHLNGHGGLTYGKLLRRLGKTLQSRHHVENEELVKN